MWSAYKSLFSRRPRWTVILLLLIAMAMPIKVWFWGRIIGEPYRTVTTILTATIWWVIMPYMLYQADRMRK